MTKPRGAARGQAGPVGRKTLAVGSGDPTARHRKGHKFCKKNPDFDKMNSKSINLMKTPEPCGALLLVIVPYSVNFVKKLPDFVKMIPKSINFMKNPLNFSVIDRYSVDSKFTK